MDAKPFVETAGQDAYEASRRSRWSTLVVVLGLMTLAAVVVLLEAVQDGPQLSGLDKILRAPVIAAVLVSAGLALLGRQLDRRLRPAGEERSPARPVNDADRGLQDR
jgi:peptidoglycan/LPS O-acetylase OafA/YrhL